MDAEMKRVFGAFYGQLIGDALGARYEFKSAEMVQKMIKQDMVDNHLPIGQRDNKPAGQVTDDSEMALSLAKSLVHCGGFNQHDVASAYACWFGTEPLDAGMATACALSIPSLLTKDSDNMLSVEKKVKIGKECVEQAKQFNPNSLSNGMLMRISPLAIGLRNAPEKDLLKAAELDCQITHPNPIVINATQFYVKLLVNLLKGQQPLDAINDAKRVVKEKLILDIISASAERATPVRLLDGREVNGDGQCQGYFGVALQCSLYELQHLQSFEESLIRVIQIGGDTDTNGCISAVLLGAYLGVDAIPKDWIQSVLNAPVDRDFFFMKPLKDKTVEDFVKQLSESCCQLHKSS